MKKEDLVPGKKYRFGDTDEVFKFIEFDLL